MQEYPSSQLPRPDAYLKWYMFGAWPSYPYQFYDTNLTEQELSDAWATQEFIEIALAWEWIYNNPIE
jgi:hypothetical protein